LRALVAGGGGVVAPALAAGVGVFKLYPTGQPWRTPIPGCGALRVADVGEGRGAGIRIVVRTDGETYECVVIERRDGGRTDLGPGIAIGRRVPGQRGAADADLDLAAAGWAGDIRSSGSLSGAGLKLHPIGGRDADKDVRRGGIAGIAHHDPALGQALVSCCNLRDELPVAGHRP
jgi:hypothetical protein